MNGFTMDNAENLDGSYTVNTTFEEVDEHMWIKLMQVMKEKKINGKKLAELTELHPVTISTLRNGTRKPSMETLEKIATALGVEKRELF